MSDAPTPTEPLDTTAAEAEAERQLAELCQLVTGIARTELARLLADGVRHETLLQQLQEHATQHDGRLDDHAVRLNGQLEALHDHRDSLQTVQEHLATLTTTSAAYGEQLEQQQAAATERAEQLQRHTTDLAAHVERIEQQSAELGAFADRLDSHDDVLQDHEVELQHPDRAAERQSRTLAAALERTVEREPTAIARALAPTVGLALRQTILTTLHLQRWPLQARWALALTPLSLLLWWAIDGLADTAQRARFAPLVHALRTEPGYVVTDARVEDDVLVVRGLMDPDAQPFTALVREHGVTDRTRAELQPYHALQPRFVVRRLRRALQPPNGVTTVFDGQTLTIRGEASHAWLQHARAIAATAEGAIELDLSSCRDRDYVAFESAKAALVAFEPTLHALRAEDGVARARLEHLVAAAAEAADHLDLQFDLEAHFVWWTVDEHSTAANTAKELAKSLSQQLERPLPVVGHVADRSVREPLLRVTVRERR